MSSTTKPKKRQNFGQEMLEKNDERKKQMKTMTKLIGAAPALIRAHS